jgi:hypothetical protein
MITINSLSGGKTSSYMAMHYEADYNIFSLVCVDDVNCKPKDAKIIQMVNDKLSKYGYTDTFGEFIGTAEDDVLLTTMFELEQMLGKEITWIRGKSFENVNKQHGKIVPNIERRYCTTDMKMFPMATFVYNQIMPTYDMMPVFSNVGFRYDEEERKSADRALKTKLVVGKRKTRNKWDEVFWGVSNYPLIYDKVTHYHVQKYWSDKSLKFPTDSNCIGCFWKDVQQLRKNWDDNPEKMEWFAKQERESNYNYKAKITYDQVKTIGLQLDFVFGTGSGCQAGYCTN